MSELEDRAIAKFSDLTSAEKMLLVAAARGLVADCGGPGDGSANGRHRSAWGESRTVRADLLRWLCVDQGAGGCVDLRGVTLSSAKIAGKLDLAYASLHFPLRILDSIVSDGIDLTHAESRLISLTVPIAVRLTPIAWRCVAEFRCTASTPWAPSIFQRARKRQSRLQRRALF